MTRRVMQRTRALERDDLFTHIHKALRKGLFEITQLVGSTDWSDPTQVAETDARWRALLQLLHSHTHHEDTYIFELLPDALTCAADEEHIALEHRIDEIAADVERLVRSPNGTDGLGLYRELALFVADYLHHLHVEETFLMQAIWERCHDDEIAATRAAFMADTPPGVMRTAVELMLPAVDARTRAAMLAGMAANSPSETIDDLGALCDRVLDPDAARAARRTIEASSGRSAAHVSEPAQEPVS